MKRVFLFGPHTLGSIPKVVEEQLENIIRDTDGNVEFLVGDSSGIETAFHMVLSRIGARSKTKVYCADYARNNAFDLPVEIFDSEGLVGRELYEARDRQMIHDCDFGICIWDGEAKGTFNCITIMKAQNKPVYVYTVQV